MTMYTNTRGTDIRTPGSAFRLFGPELQLTQFSKLRELQLGAKQTELRNPLRVKTACFGCPRGNNTQTASFFVIVVGVWPPTGSPLHMRPEEALNLGIAFGLGASFFPSRLAACDRTCSIAGVPYLCAEVRYLQFAGPLLGRILESAFYF